MALQDFELGKWISGKWKTQVAFSEKLGVHQGRVSRWLNGQDGISAEYQAAIRKLGYTGPWPQEEAQDAAAGGPALYVTREEFEDVPGRLKRLEEDSRALLPLIRLVGDLGERVKKLEKHLGLAE